MFLKTFPIVYVIGDEYEVFLLAKEKGIFSLVVNGVRYYEENCGVLSSEKNYAKIRIKQTTLDAQKRYTVAFRKTIERKAYFSELEEPQYAEFSFKPLTKRENIKAYHVADVHCNYGVALNTCSYFGEELDLLIANGDMGEVETVEDYEKAVEFIGEIAKGEIPVVCARGNHDTRGKLAELFTEYFPANGKKTYYTFQVGCLNGVVLDVGEDKIDEFKVDESERRGTPYVYNGTNVFHEYRKEQVEFLKGLCATTPLDFAVCHIPPAKATDDAGTVFDIERDTYAKLNEELQRLKIKFMLSGHFHRTFILEKQDSRSFIPHDYPIIIGSEIKIVGADTTTKEYQGTALTIHADGVFVEFTNSNREAVDTRYIHF